PRRVPSLGPPPSTAGMPRSGPHRRFPAGTAPSFEFVPPLTKELIDAQRVDRPFAIDIVRSYTDRLYVVVRNAIGAGGEDQSAPRHAILAPDGRIASADDPTQPAVPLMTFQVLPFDLTPLGDIGTHPRIHIHLPAAVRTLSSMRSAEELGSSALFLDVLDRTWFLLAFWLSTSLGYGQMLGPDRALIVDLVECCSHLHALSGTAELPLFVIDAIDRELEIQYFNQEWVTHTKVRTADGKIYDEGRYVSRNTERPLRAGALLREHYRRDQATVGDPGAMIALGRLKAESGDLVGARAAFEQLRSHPAYVHHAEHCLRDLLPEEACQELVSIYVQGPPKEGSQAMTRVEQIGQKLHDAGGIDLMLHVHHLFSAGRRSDARDLEMTWGGIGSWKH
ncbi:MAG: hypothetical protein ACRDRU_10580, partial [Pseudonocardiaceae bacterium]